MEDLSIHVTEILRRHDPEGLIRGRPALRANPHVCVNYDLQHAWPFALP